MARTRTPKPPVHLTSARMLDPDGERLVAPGQPARPRGRITEVSPTSVPDGATTLDLGDVTLLPGLMDMEVNLRHGRVPPRQPAGRRSRRTRP